MLLNKAQVGIKYKIVNLLGKDNTNTYFKSLGLAKGEEVVILSKISGNYIVLAQDTRYGLEERVAKLIEVTE